MILGLLNLLLAGAARLSEPAVAKLSEGLGWFWWRILRYRRGVITENLQRAFPEQTPSQRDALGERVTTHLVQTLIEFLRIPLYVETGLERVVRFEGFEHLDAARAEGKGVLCLTGHLGSFELAVAAVARGRPVSLVVKSFPGAVDTFVTQIRRSAGLEMIPARRAMRPILQALRSNRAVAFVLDQNATRQVGTFVDFFGESASTYTALARLAVRTGTPVVVAQPFREGAGRHVLRVSPPIFLEARASEEETVQHMTQVYTRAIERAIREHPEQWFWTHKRWRTRPAFMANARALETLGEHRTGGY